MYLSKRTICIILTIALVYGQMLESNAAFIPITIEDTSGNPSINNVKKIIFNGAILTNDNNGQITVTVTDSETLDNLDSTQFLRSDTSTAYTSGTITFNTDTTVNIESTNLSIADTDINFTGANTIFRQNNGAFSLTPNTGSDLNVNLAGGGQLKVTGAIEAESIKLTTNATNNYVLVSDTTGNGVWTDPSLLLANGNVFLNALNDVISDAQSNLFLGNGAGLNHTGLANTGVGINALTSITSGNGNVAFGYAAGSTFNTGSNNVLIGDQAGIGMTSGDNNIFIGNVNGSSATASNELNIGDLLFGNFANGNIGIGVENPTNFELEIAGHFGPNVNSSYDIGSNLLKFRNAFIDDLNITNNGDFGNDISVANDLSVGNDLAVDNNGSIGVNLLVGNNLTVVNSANIAEDLSVGNDLAISNNGSVAGDFTIGNNLGITGSAGITGNISANSGIFSNNVNGDIANFNTGNFNTINTSTINASTLTTNFTNGSVIFANDSGNLDQDNNNFFWDRANNRLGLGTNNPLQTLDVDGNIRITGGSPAKDKVLASLDSAGNGYWMDISTILTNGGAFLSALNDVISDAQSNLFLGNGAGLNHTGLANTGVGINALTSITSGNGNVAFGYAAGSTFNTGSNNVLIGDQAGIGMTSGDNNIFIGNVNGSSATASNQLNIGDLLFGNFANGNIGIGVENPTNFELEIAGHFGPNVNSSYDIGSNLLRFRNAFIDDLNITNNGDFGNDISIANDLSVGNDLTVGNNGAIAVDLSVGANLEIGSDAAIIGNLSAANIISSGVVNGTIANFDSVIVNNNINGSDLFISNNGDFGNDLAVGNNLVVTSQITADLIRLNNNASDGYVLTSDANGLASWQSVSSLGADASTLNGFSNTDFLKSNGSDAFTTGTLTLDPGTTLHVNGIFRYTDGNEDENFVLSSDVNGVATWVNINTLTASGHWSNNGHYLYPTDNDGDQGIALGSTHSEDADVFINHNGGALFNRNRLEENFQISTNGDEFAFFVNGSTNNIGIGYQTASSKLDVNGDITSIGFNGNTATFSDEVYTGSLISAGIVNGTIANFNSVIVANNINGADLFISNNGDFGNDLYISNDLDVTNNGSIGVNLIVGANLSVGSDAAIIGNLSAANIISSGVVNGTIANFDSVIVNNNINGSDLFISNNGDFGNDLTVGNNLVVTSQITADLIRLNNNANDGYVLTSDANGLASWQSVSSLGADASTLNGFSNTDFLKSNGSDAFTTGTLTLDPGTTLHVNGIFRYTDGNEDENFVLKSDANGVATWVNINTLTASGHWSNNGHYLYPTDNDGDQGIALGSTHSEDADVFINHNGGALFNRNRMEENFQISTNGDEFAFFVNGAANNIGIGYQTASSKLDVNGDITSIGFNGNTATFSDEVYTGSLISAGIVNGTIANFNSVIVANNINGADLFISNNGDFGNDLYISNDLDVTNNGSIGVNLIVGANLSVGSDAAIIGNLSAANIISSGVVNGTIANFDSVIVNNNINGSDLFISNNGDFGNDLAVGNNLVVTSQITADLIRLNNNASDGYVLTSDANGLASWQSVSSLGADASTLNGFSSSDFLKSNGSTAFTTGTLTMNPGTILHTDGSFRYTDGNEANNYVLKSDANGVATWVNINTLTASGHWSNNGHYLHPTDNDGDQGIALGSTHSEDADVFINHNGGALFNRNRLEENFQISTNGDEFAFFVNGSTNNIGIGYQTASSKLDVNGDITSIGLNGSSASFSGAVNAGILISSGAVNGTIANFDSIIATNNINGSDLFISNNGNFANDLNVTNTVSADNFIGGTFNGSFIGNGSGLIGVTPSNITGFIDNGANLIFTGTGTIADPYVINIASGATTAGSTGQIQFNSGSSFGADSLLHWDNTEKRLGVGTNNPVSELTVNGSIFTTGLRLSTGAGDGHVLVSDANGVASWVAPASLSVTGDDLGNHTATTNLNMATNDVTNVGTITATNFTGGSFNGTFIGDGSGLTGLVIDLDGLDLGNQDVNGVLTFVAGGMLQDAYLNGQTLITNGDLIIRTTAPSDGHVLVSDANGLASWAAPSSLSGISDAATLGGLAATSFLRSDATTTYTSGTITFNSGTTVAIASTNLSIADTDISFTGANTTFTQSTGAFTMAPAAGSNFNVNLSGAGDFVVNDNQLYVDTSTTNVGIGYATPAYKLAVNGTAAVTGLRMTTGSGVGKILTSDASGDASWEDAPSGADNLGNHTATTNLNMATNDVTNVGTITATNFTGGSFNGTFIGDGSGLTGLVIDLDGLDLGNQDVNGVLTFVAGGMLQDAYLNGQTLITNGDLIIRTTAPSDGPRTCI
jgi:UDP-3-O-[3-hydroxymyristoyl] glucosamine N-acyltransferase